MVKQRLEIIDIMQGIAMLLVILGHHLFPFAPMEYKDFHYYLYSFHMPLFIFISSFLIRYSFKNVSNWQEYKLYVKKKFKKFFVSYVFIGLSIIILSNISCFDVHNILRDIGCLIYAPKQGTATFLWYIYLLLIFYALTPFIVRLNIVAKYSLVVLGLLGYWYALNIPYLCIDYLSKYFLFYIIGIIVAENIEEIKKFRSTFYILSFILFCLASYLQINSSYDKILLLLPALLSIPTFYIISRMIQKTVFIKKWIVVISIYCFPIYLLHMFFVQGGALFYYNIGGTNMIPYFIYLLVSTVMSILLSIYTYKVYGYLKSGF